jgi:hypothetical protein
MNKNGHEITNAIALIILMLLSAKITITMIIIPILYLASAPDKDHGWDAHRHWFYHGIVPLIIVLLFIPIDALGYVVIPLFSIALHCLMDVSLKTKGGFYTIVVWRKRRLNYKQSTIWLFLQFIGGSIILGVWLVLV